MNDVDIPQFDLIEDPDETGTDFVLPETEYKALLSGTRWPSSLAFGAF